MSKKITIVGAGLAGSLLAIYLAKKGFSVDLYEKRPDMRVIDTAGGRSINLALSARGIFALREVGLYDEIMNSAIHMHGRSIHSLDGSTRIQPYGISSSDFINSISRSELNKKLMNKAESFENVKIYFNKRCNRIDFSKNELYFTDVLNGKIEVIKPEVVIATDGATSPVRLSMLRVPRFDFSQVYENYGYKELTITPTDDGKFRMFENALHIWPRGAYMLIALPNIDKSFTATLFIAYDKSFGGNASFEYLSKPKLLNDFFKSNFPDALDMMPALSDEFFSNPLGHLITIKCYPWFVGNTLLLGDSAHAIVPFFGQGMNAAFEDCTYLNEIIGMHGDNWPIVFTEFQEMRKENTDAIADLAQENFIEMRDLVNDKEFLFRKKIEAELAKRFPEKFIPKYSMVTFNRMPYAKAHKHGQIQDNILIKLSENKKNLDEVDWDLAEKMIDEQLYLI